MRLRMFTAAGKASEIVITGTDARLGKDPACEVPFDASEYPMVSSLHARVERSGAEWLLTHLSQSNKTLVNDQPVAAVVKLKAGDRIRLGYTGPCMEVMSVEAGPVAGMVLDLGTTVETGTKSGALPRAPVPMTSAKFEPVKPKSADAPSPAPIIAVKKRPQPARDRGGLPPGLVWGGIGVSAVVVVALLAFFMTRSKPRPAPTPPPSEGVVRKEPDKIPAATQSIEAKKVPETLTAGSLALELRNASGPARKKALEKLWPLGPQARPALEALLEVLKDPDLELRRLALEILARMGPPIRDDLPIYAAALRQSSSELCAYAASQLGVLGRDARSELVFLRVLTLGADDVVKDAAQKAVLRIEADLLAGLIQGLQDNSVSVRCQSARELADMGANAKAALANLIEALADTNSAVRLAVLDVFWAIGPDAVMVLGEALRDKNPVVRLNAIDALGRMGPDARFVLPELIAMIYDSDAKTREETLLALARIGDYAIPYLLTNLEREKNLARQTALLEALERIGHDAGPAVQKALKSARPDVVKAAAHVLKKVESQSTPEMHVPHTGSVLQIQDHLRAWFKAADTNNDGFLDKHELAIAIRGPNAKPFDYNPDGKNFKKLSANDFAKYPDFAFLSRLDRNNDGRVTWSDFESWSYDYAAFVKKDADERERIFKAQQRVMEHGLSEAARKQNEIAIAQAWTQYQQALRAQHYRHHMEWLHRSALARVPPRK